MRGKVFFFNFPFRFICTPDRLVRGLNFEIILTHGKKSGDCGVACKG